MNQQNLFLYKCKGLESSKTFFITVIVFQTFEDITQACLHLPEYCRGSEVCQFDTLPDVRDKNSSHPICLKTEKKKRTKVQMDLQVQGLKLGDTPEDLTAIQMNLNRLEKWTG